MIKPCEHVKRWRIKAAGRTFTTYAADIHTANAQFVNAIRLGHVPAEFMGLVIKRDNAPDFAPEAVVDNRPAPGR